MEKRKTFHGRQVGKKRLLPIVFPLFLFLLIPLNGYGDDTPMPEVVQQNSTRITGVVKDAYGEPVIGANVMVELAFEQHRFWDVRRWKEGGFTKIGRMQITQKEDGNFLYERTNKSLVWDDKMYFFPIPASEMRKNPNLSQNPGW